MVYLGKSIEKSMHIRAKPILFKRAQEMRKNPTDTEKLMWKMLRRFRHEKYIFRRQHPIDIFIADFYCHKLRLVIEVDGGIHSDVQAQEHDDGRTAELERFGIKVLRFTNNEVILNQDFVLKQISEYITASAYPALPGAGDGRG